MKSQEQLLDHEESLYGEQAAHLQGQDGQKALDMSGRKGSKTASRSAFATLFHYDNMLAHRRVWWPVGLVCCLGIWLRSVSGMMPCKLACTSKAAKAGCRMAG